MPDREIAHHAPLYKTVAEIGALWVAADLGFRFLLPLFGLSISYNDSPVAITIYYIAWFAISLSVFSHVFRYFTLERRLWIYALSCMVFSAIVWMVAGYITANSIVEGPPLAPFTDILFATPWYFLPKSAEILVQQTLIAALILALYARFRSVRSVSIGYVILFGGTHVLIFALSGAPTPYATAMTLGAVASAVSFPYLVLRVPSGFVYTFIIHIAYYMLFVVISHTWPPPGYG